MSIKRDLYLRFLNPYFEYRFSKCANHKNSFLSECTHWKNCSLVSKIWNQASQENHPFSIAIKNNLKERVIELLGRGCSPKMRIWGTKIVPAPIANYTPYFCAREHQAHEIADLLFKKEEGFSQRFIEMKLIALKFDLKGDYLVDGVKFEAAGLDHLLHHKYLIPNLHDSLNQFFQQNKEIKIGDLVWDLNCTKRLLKALNGDFPCCTVCPSKNKGRSEDQLFIYSDTKKYGNTHWISVVFSKELIALGNRGLGSNKSPGTTIYKHQNTLHNPHVMQTERLTELMNNFKESNKKLSFSMPAHKSGSCSKSSLEAVLAGANYIILKEKYPHRVYDLEVELTAVSIFNQWLNFDCIHCLDHIMKTDHLMNYDILLLSHVLEIANGLDKNKKIVSDFCKFVRNKKRK